jgi:hypothetical protein
MEIMWGPCEGRSQKAWRNRVGRVRRAFCDTKGRSPMERVTQIEPHHQLGKIGSAICHAVSDNADPAHRGGTGVTVTNRAPPSRVARLGRRPSPPLD